VKFLFVHQNFPGQYLHIVRHLVAQKQHEVIFLTEENPNHIAGVRKIVHRMPAGADPHTHFDVREFELAIQRAHIIAAACASLKQLGFVPDIVIGHHGWGELLNIQDIYPDVPLLGYCEFFYHVHGIDVGFDPEFPMNPMLYSSVRTKNAVNFLALNGPGEGQTPTRFQLGTYPEWARAKINLLPEGADLDATKPDPSVRKRAFQFRNIVIPPSQKLVSYVARDLEPYRGFHIIMRALPKLLRERSDVQVMIIGQDGVSYGAKLSEGCWRERMLAELKGQFDLSRVHFLGRVDHADYLKVLQRSDTHVYLTYPFVASWSLREALASGCMVVASDTAPVRDFVTDGENGVLTPCLDPQLLAETVAGTIDDTSRTRRLRAGARAYAEAHLPMDAHLAAFDALIARMTGGKYKPVKVKPATPPKAEVAKAPTPKPHSPKASAPKVPAAKTAASKAPVPKAPPSKLAVKKRPRATG
jgi:glycosyltransferase involved in cell wall biosynthesis